MPPSGPPAWRVNHRKAPAVSLRILELREVCRSTSRTRNDGVADLAPPAALIEQLRHCRHKATAFDQQVARRW